jgi:hypothetical protein
MIKQTFAILGSLFILGTGAAQAAGQTRDRNQAQRRTETRNEVRYRFVDENGDGICDLHRDHDNDGIPNCRDTDWNPPRDGSGNKSRFGQEVSGNAMKNGLGKSAGSRAGGGPNSFQRDDDGDGIPNGQDSDWQRPLDGSGYKGRFGAASFSPGLRGVSGFGLGRGTLARNLRVSRPGLCTGTGPGRLARRAR